MKTADSDLENLRFIVSVWGDEYPTGLVGTLRALSAAHDDGVLDDEALIQCVNLVRDTVQEAFPSKMLQPMIDHILNNC